MVKEARQVFLQSLTEMSELSHSLLLTNLIKYYQKLWEIIQNYDKLSKIIKNYDKLSKIMINYQKLW